MAGVKVTSSESLPFLVAMVQSRRFPVHPQSTSTVGPENTGMGDPRVPRSNVRSLGTSEGAMSRHHCSMRFLRTPPD